MMRSRRTPRGPPTQLWPFARGSRKFAPVGPVLRLLPPCWSRRQRPPPARLAFRWFNPLRSELTDQIDQMPEIAAAVTTGAATLRDHYALALVSCCRHDDILRCLREATNPQRHPNEQACLLVLINTSITQESNIPGPRRREEKKFNSEPPPLQYFLGPLSPESCVLLEILYY
jgi:hypothetical protein